MYCGAFVRLSWPYPGAFATILKTKDECLTNSGGWGGGREGGERIALGNDQAISLGNRGVHDVGCIMGNQGKMAGNSKVCMENQSLIFLFRLKHLRLPLLKQSYMTLTRMLPWLSFDILLVNMFSPYIPLFFL